MISLVLRGKLRRLRSLPQFPSPDYGLGERVKGVFPEFTSRKWLVLYHLRSRCYPIAS